MTARLARLCPLLLLLAVCAAGAQEPAALARNHGEEARWRLQQVEQLYFDGDYQACRRLLDSYLQEQDSGTFRLPPPVLARIYGLRALVAYAFRGEGEAYREEVRGLLWKAVDQDPEVELGSPSQIPAFVQEVLLGVRREYLAQFARTRRRFQIGLLGALVIDPTVVVNPSVLQPGVYFSYNIGPVLSLIAGLRLPLALPLWGSIRGQVGLGWYPSFAVGKLSPSVAVSYLFSLDNLQTYTHSISLAAQTEVISRLGIGAGIRAELVRLDLIFGLSAEKELPTYRSTALFGESVLRVSFANMSFFIFYAF